MFYAIKAHSKTCNQTQREFDEDSLKGRPTTTLKLAEQKASAFATRLNRQSFLQCTDWTGEVELINNTNIYAK